jgi:hypothetical protein
MKIRPSFNRRNAASLLRGLSRPGGSSFSRTTGSEGATVAGTGAAGRRLMAPPAASEACEAGRLGCTFDDSGGLEVPHAGTFAVSRTALVRNKIRDTRGKRRNRNRDVAFMMGVDKPG